LTAGDRQTTVTQVFHEYDDKGEGTILPEDLAEILALLGASKADLTPAELRALADGLYDSHGDLGVGGSGGRKYIPYIELMKAFLLSEKEFRSKYPQPRVNKGEEKLLYERLLNKKKNVIVGSKTPKEKIDATAPPSTKEEAFLAGCKKIDYKNTGFIRYSDINAGTMGNKGAFL